MKVLPGPSPWSEGRSCPLPLPASTGCLCSLAQGLPSSNGITLTSASNLVIPSLTLDASASLLWRPFWLYWAIWIIQDNLLHLRILNIITSIVCFAIESSIFPSSGGLGPFLCPPHVARYLYNPYKESSLGPHSFFREPLLCQMNRWR